MASRKGLNSDAKLKTSGSVIKYSYDRQCSQGRSTSVLASINDQSEPRSHFQSYAAIFHVLKSNFEAECSLKGNGSVRACLELKSERHYICPATRG
jgi:hypothetical protein